MTISTKHILRKQVAQAIHTHAGGRLSPEEIVESLRGPVSTRHLLERAGMDDVEFYRLVNEKNRALSGLKPGEGPA